MRSLGWRTSFKHSVYGTRIGMGRYSDWSRSQKLSESHGEKPSSVGCSRLSQYVHQSQVCILAFTCIFLTWGIILLICFFLFRTVVFKQNFNQGRISQNQLDDQNREGNVQVQCFPIYSILAALNQTRVDYFSLDIEGDELAVLKTIPWHNVHIQVIFETT